MYDVLFHFFRRMRTPLIVLIVSYATSVIGFVLIPGVDAKGDAWNMSFFHAFYIVSYTASTIGYGEIPYPFTDAQRMWASVSIYLTVISWLYAIGNLLTIIQSPAFQDVIEKSSFARRVRRIKSPFYLICGYGDTGSLLVHAMSERGMAMVVIDDSRERINALETEDLIVPVPGVCADASDSETLVAAGLTNPYCAGVIAVTDHEEANLLIAISCKLLSPKVPVICRAETDDMESNMKSFGTDYIINPYHRFANRLGVAIRSPSLFMLYDWFTHANDVSLGDPKRFPKGRWIICGYGRFGKALQRFLSYEGIATSIVEIEPEKSGAPAGTILGRGTEAVTLREAEIDDAVGLIAGTDNDANNLSIIMTARHLRPDIFIIARQNERKNSRNFEAFKPDIVMQPSMIIAQRVLSRIQTPLLAEFLRVAHHCDEKWAGSLVQQIRSVIREQQPYVWTISVDEKLSPALTKMIRDNRAVTIEAILRDPTDINEHLRCVPLMLQRGEKSMLVPSGSQTLELGDRILFCGREMAERKMLTVIENEHLLVFCMTGREQPMSAIWRRLKRRETIMS